MCIIGLYLGTKYEVCRWNSISDMSRSLVFYQFGESMRDMAHFLDFGPFLRNLIRTCDLDQRNLGHWMCLIRLHLDTKYEVCGSNRFWDMNTGWSNFHFDDFSWLIWAKKINYQIHHWNCSKLFYHHTKFEVDRSNGLEIIWNWNFPH